MTCVACSGSIERLMHKQFDSKDLVSASIVLLTHKMTAVFQRQAQGQIVDAEEVCQAVLAIGFGCKLLLVNELTNEKKAANSKDSDSNTDGQVDFMSNLSSTISTKSAGQLDLSETADLDTSMDDLENVVRDL